MLILTIQERSVVDAIKKGTYKPNFWKSKFSCMSVEFTKGYAKILSRLKEKTGAYLSDSDSCLWGWAKAPYIRFHTATPDWKENSVAVFAEVPDSEVVLSDFDVFSEYVLGESDREDYILDNFPDDENMCVQCSFLNIKPENILLEVDMSRLIGNGCRTSVESLYIGMILMQEFERLKSMSRLAEGIGQG